ncbi:Rieske 2Fe-2S domain-containing protein [Alicyclobacillus fastidiosus]|uniref:Rieske 2Fe-2S domain-containing protein n=1 Tax=Alicyclobacillus fastidiosus TaxID=392011 RepID=A0ABY6ZCL3_9BACL|nr:Rieske 2Fe-2S domain-containing protein [Alicyclobacillus fastidiosus]WAH40252.1 Rieske 2Fe-2S domain-containing protein [Alicyclobacillus fastidiosus]
MLSKEDNALITQVGPGTAMGAVMREYWLPILLSCELQEKDGRPLRVRVLGEDLVAFRDSNGTIGLLEEHCPHRGASLYFGRNEECGLRCVYHGWKYDVNGNITDMPNEPPQSTFKDRLKAIAYPCVERNGTVWAYLGSKCAEQRPSLPDLEWNLVPQSRCYISKRYQECNWVQAYEGGIDSSHVSFLHSRLNSTDFTGSPREQGMKYMAGDKFPHYETLETPYGMMVGARRSAEPGFHYWRITQCLMPFYTILPSYGADSPVSGHAWVPIDDHTTMVWTITWHPTRDLTEEELDDMRYWSPDRVGTSEGNGRHLPLDMYIQETSNPGSRWKPKLNKGNDYLIDWEAQATKAFSGIPTISMQDQAVQESMGPIYDRRKEHLGTADMAIIRMRQLWLKAAKGLRDRQVVPVGLYAPQSYHIRSASIRLPDGIDWASEATQVTSANQDEVHFI